MKTWCCPPLLGRNERNKRLLKATHKIFIWLAGVTLLVVALEVALAFWSFRQTREAAAVRDHTHIALNKALELLSALNDAETGQRGYLLTGGETFLEPYLAVCDNVRDRLEELRRLTLIPPAQKHLAALAPLMAAKLAHMAEVIELRRNHDMTAVLAAVSRGQGKRLMDAIRVEMSGFIAIKEVALAQREAEFHVTMRRMLIIIITASVCALLFALAFTYLVYRGIQQQLESTLHRQTRHLLEIQEQANRQLQQAMATVQVSEEKLAVTLNSIGDAVIATDAAGRVTLLNPQAVRLTGWPLAETCGRPADHARLRGIGIQSRRTILKATEQTTTPKRRRAQACRQTMPQGLP